MSVDRPACPSRRAAIATMAAMMLAGCETLPNSGPTSASVRSPSVSTALSYVLIEVSGDTIDGLATFRPSSLRGTSIEGTSFASKFTDNRPAPIITLGVGDVLSLSIFEAAPGGLFTPAQTAGARPGNFVSLPNQLIDQNGNLAVPYAGLVPASGRTIPQVQAEIENRLRNRAIEPQAVISLIEQHSATVSILGEVNTPGALALNTSGERILQVLARAGGSRYQAIESYLTLQRGGRGARVLLNNILKDPSENIFMRPGDVLYVSREAPTFMALGASGLNGLFTFDTEFVTLTQAIGKAGGLLDAQADSSSVFVYRLETRGILKRLGIDVDLYPPGPIPTIFNINLREPSGYSLASRFQMRDKDVIFAANAKSVDFLKLLNVIDAATASLRSANGGVQEFRSLR